jgi:pimeloyl-ACP methyl ester carboxylesterase
MDSLGIGRATLFAHSFGGNEITRFAALHPERVDALVYLDAHFESGENPRYEQAMASAPHPACVSSLNTREDLRACAAAYLMPPHRWTPALDELIGDMLVDSRGPLVYRTSAEHVSESLARVNAEYERDYERIRTRALFLMSDTYFSVATADTAWNRAVREWHETGGYVEARKWWFDDIGKAMPQARVVVKEGTSHDNMVEFDTVYAEIVLFLAEVRR